ncbi:hypothetical protein D3P07_20785 [Paenibacillus sp. 1011MAR3C5]|uniref:DUF6470 family protein n=1 Tax=Paenibacillus sp. 1011MAR3C5 TaxID=1675787 RepID=UPI000E6CF35F|nr:DUF6470 family protein [Paenibacillus sp. 1011MAR3C5]RJE85632.1 hypothetical protein D3P07_20785 [Paenibacillus sp. 1011MAR3C5]
MRFPQIQIEQIPARLDITSTQGKFDIRQKSATMNVQSTPGVLEVESEPPVVIVDMTKTWDALTGGKPISFMNRIYDQFGQFVQHAIENTVSTYNQIGDLTLEENPIGEIAIQNMLRQPPKVQIYGEASVANISFEAHVSPPRINYTPGKVDIETIPNKPQVDFQRGGVQYQMTQYPAVRITPPQIDIFR